MSESKTVSSQRKSLIKVRGGKTYIAEVRWDDQCRNGHNSFAITCSIYLSSDIEYVRKNLYNDHLLESCGMNHEAVARVFPEIAHLLKWHLCGSTGPMHYFSNAKYWAGFSPVWPPADDPKEQKCYPGNEDHLKSTIVYGALPGDLEEDITSMNWIFLEAFLVERLPRLMAQMEKEITEFGFIW